MSNKLLKDAGMALYGPRWQSDLARDLDVSDRTVRRWAVGAIDAPAGVYIDLLCLVTERQDDLGAIAERLKTSGAPS